MVPKKPMTTNASRFARVENPRGRCSIIGEAGWRLTGPGGGVLGYWLLIVSLMCVGWTRPECVRVTPYGWPS